MVQYLILPSDQTTFTNVSELSGSADFENYRQFLKHFIFSDLMPSKRLSQLQRIWTNCRARPGSMVLSITATLLETLDVFGLDAVQNTNKTEQNMNELFRPLGKRSFWALSTLLGSLYVFEIDADQNTMKTEKTVNELSGSPGKHNFEHYQHS